LGDSWAILTRQHPEIAHLIARNSEVSPLRVVLFEESGVSSTFGMVLATNPLHFVEGGTAWWV
jgi:hypothetical protein